MPLPKHPPNRPGGPPRFCRSRFFACYAYYNHSLRYSRNVKYQNYFSGIPIWGTPLGGAPPGPLSPPQGSPGVREFWKKMQTFSKIILKNYMHQNTPNVISNIYFEPPGLQGGGGLWGTKSRFDRRRVFFCTESKNSKHLICFYRFNKHNATGIETKF